MKKILILFAIIGFALFGCSQESKNEISGVAAESNSGANSDIKKRHLELKGAEEIGIFERAVNNSKKVPGIANMANPMYSFSFDEEFYSLWITEEAGTIMNRKDTTTIYTLTSSSAEEVYRFVNKE
ncbi:hypothetical protein MHH33_03070 [Paenisporosarcina sp. FSL H8-0542]|uniref:hypothetical protein n=1 Tax=Paenisporosarcina sp. FSL H8-0542 TaxID=2921401 RepID=UPI00315A5F08